MLGFSGPAHERIVTDLLHAGTEAVHVLARNEALRAQAAHLDPARVIATVGDPFRAPLPRDMALCVVAVGPGQVPDLIEELLYDRIHPALAPGGIAILPLMRNAPEKLRPELREPLQTALDGQFGEAAITTAGLRQRFESDCFFGLIDSTFEADADSGWIALRRREPVGAARAFARLPRSDRFALADFERLLARD